jgi:hypothetical protein
MPLLVAVVAPVAVVVVEADAAVARPRRTSLRRRLPVTG